MPVKRVVLRAGADLQGFRDAARRLIADDVAPDDVSWESADAPSLFGEAAEESAAPVVLPKAAAALVALVVCHRDSARFAQLYRMIWRLRHGERALLEIASDPLTHKLEMMAKAVRRDLHKMHAFLRFRRIEDGRGERFVAWFEPDHYIVEATASFFVNRFGSMVWSILTPVGSLHWDRRALTIGPAARRENAPDSDPFEAGWRGYYESAFNPARVNPSVMRGHMPKKYWKNLPEAQAIPGLIENAPSRVREMIEREAAMPKKRDPARAVATMADQAPASLEALNRIIAAAEPLVPGATQAVLGEGPIGAAIALVGEQPGDQEDAEGRPFVGPAGQLLSRALAEAGIDRRLTYVTNAVKHFKFVQRGKRRLHQSPTAGEVKHYRWWLQKELDFVAPQVTVALGATAALALAGEPLVISRCRGPARFGGREGFITVHPSYLLRLPDEAARIAAYDAFVADLRRVKTLANSGAARNAA